MRIGFPDPLQISSRVESQQVLRPTLVYHELIMATQELSYGLGWAFAVPPEYRMAMDVRVLNDHIVPHGNENVVQLKFSQDVISPVIRIKDDHCRPTLRSHTDLVCDLGIG